MSSPFDSSIYNRPEHIKLLADYLAKRGLEPSDFPDGLTVVGNPRILQQEGFISSLAGGRPFFFLDYLDPAGEKQYEESDKLKEKPHRVARFLGSIDPGWKGDVRKVLSPNGRPALLHFEPIPDYNGEPQSWHTLKDGDLVIHVESMIKAKAVSKYTGLPCIGYSGVASYHSSRKGIELIHTKYDVDFTRLKHVIVFDANTKTNPNVIRAREGLMFKLRNVLGCKDVNYIDLPIIDGDDKAGPDDFIQLKGAEALLELISAAESYEGAEHEDLMAQMIDRAVYCLQSGTIIDRTQKILMKESHASMMYAKINKKVLRGKAVSTVYGYNVWKEHVERKEVLNPGYEYLGQEFITKADGEYYNVYQPSGPWPMSRTGEEVRLESQNGRGEQIEQGASAKAWEAVQRQLANMMSPNDLDLFRSYLKFLKFTPRKPTSFPVLFSDKRGVGKGWIASLAFNLIGKANCETPKATTFVSNFNRQIANKRLLVVNEFKLSTKSEKDQAMNSLKNFFGDVYITVEPKGVDSYQVENRAGMIITCNALEDIPTDGLGDRRMWYVDCTNDYVVERNEWRVLHEAIEDPEVMDEFFWWVRDADTVDFSTWLPPLDETKIRAVMAASGSLTGSCHEALHVMRERELVVVDFLTIKGWLATEFPQSRDLATRTITIAMRDAGWTKSEKRYGKSPTDQRHVWIVNGEKFESLAGMGGSAVLAEVTRSELAMGDKH